jgi:hypothetical protein
LCFSGRILFLAGANHRQSDKCRKEKRFFHNQEQSVIDLT